MAENTIIDKINALWEEQKAALDKRDELLKKDSAAAISDLKEILYIDRQGRKHRRP